MSDNGARTPYLLCALAGLGGLFFGVTGPLLSNFIPPMVRNVLGEERTLIGAVLALAAFVAVLLVPRGAGEAETGPENREPIAGAVAVSSPPA